MSPPTVLTWNILTKFKYLNYTLSSPLSNAGLADVTPQEGHKIRKDSPKACIFIYIYRKGRYWIKLESRYLKKRHFLFIYIKCEQYIWRICEHYVSSSILLSHIRITVELFCVCYVLLPKIFWWLELQILFSRAELWSALTWRIVCMLYPVIQHVSFSCNIADSFLGHPVVFPVHGKPCPFRIVSLLDQDVFFQNPL
jgi:hypothetical protein